MGDVIEFRPLATSARQRRAAAETSDECRILFFTGVRYERHDSPEADVPAPQPGAGTKSGVGPKRGKRRA